MELDFGKLWDEIRALECIERSDYGFGNDSAIDNVLDILRKHRDAQQKSEGSIEKAYREGYLDGVWDGTDPHLATDEQIMEQQTKSWENSIAYQRERQ